jgi:hypothetical protein
LLDRFDRGPADRRGAVNDATCIVGRERHPVRVTCVAPHRRDELLFVLSTSLEPAFTPKRQFHDLLRRP